MARISKISKLPRTIREDLNERLDRSETARSILKWLNAIPAVHEMLKESFNCEPVNEQNITNWRRSGFAAWQLRQDFMDRLEILQDESTDIESAADKMADHAARLLAIQFAMMLSPSSGSQSRRSFDSPQKSSPSSKSSSKARPSRPCSPSRPPSSRPPEPTQSSVPTAQSSQQSPVPIAQSSLKSLCDLTRAVVSLRRSDCHAARLKLLLDQAQAAKKPNPEQSSLAQQIAEIRSRRYVGDRLAPLPESKTPSLPESKNPVPLSPLPDSNPNPPADSGAININQDIPSYSHSYTTAGNHAPSSPHPKFPFIMVRADLGDLTPAYARWLLYSEPLEAVRERYADRERYLPEDVQAALKQSASTPSR